MNKEMWREFYQKQKKSMVYWASVILLVDAVLAVQQITLYMQTKTCRNYLEFGNIANTCSVIEFVKQGWMWISFTNAFLFIPAAFLMVVATYAVDKVFVKKN